MVYTLLIKNGRIVDGSGKPPFVGDVGILGEYIKDIGEPGSLGDRADRVIDATNLVVAPGFIDLTNHSDTYGTLFSVPAQDSILHQGITTILVGNCGYSLAPLITPEAFSALGRWTDTGLLNIDWSSVGELHEALKRRGVGVNVATLVGHETLRLNAPTREGKIVLLSQALKEGAWGLSSNFSFANMSEDLIQETKELCALVKQHNGLYKIHIGDEGSNVLPSVAGVVVLARETGVRTVISHFKAIGRKSWHDLPRALGILKQARREGVDIAFDAFPYLRTGSMLLNLLPPWARSGSNEEIRARFLDPALKEQMIQDLGRLTIHPDRIIIASAQEEKVLVGKTLARISTDLGVSPETAIVEILKTNALGVTIFGKTLSAKNLFRAVKEEYAIVATDGAGYNEDIAKGGDLAHPRSFGAFPRFLHSVAPKASLNLETSIQKITSLPARALGLSDRGSIIKNYRADLVIFDPVTLRDTATYYHSYRYAEGIRHVILAGETALETTTRFGTILTKQ